MQGGTGTAASTVEQAVRAAHTNEACGLWLRNPRSCIAAINGTRTSKALAFTPGLSRRVARRARTPMPGPVVTLPPFRRFAQPAASDACNVYRIELALPPTVDILSACIVLMAATWFWRHGAAIRQSFGVFVLAAMITCWASARRLRRGLVALVPKTESKL